jgi:hypothetical protein
MLRLQETLTVVRAISKTTFHHLLAIKNWILLHLSWPVVGWITTVLFAFGGLMVRADEFTPAIILFSIGSIILLVKFTTWPEVRDIHVAQRSMLILFALLALSVTYVYIIQWINGLRPVPPNIVATPELGQPNKRLLRLLNSKTTLQGVRIQVIEHVQGNDAQSLQEQSGTVYRDIGLVQPYTPIPIGTIELGQGPEDVFQVNAITPYWQIHLHALFQKKV